MSFVGDRLWPTLSVMSSDWKLGGHATQCFCWHLLDEGRSRVCYGRWQKKVLTSTNATFLWRCLVKCLTLFVFVEQEVSAGQLWHAVGTSRGGDVYGRKNWWSSRCLMQCDPVMHVDLVNPHAVGLEQLVSPTYQFIGRWKLEQKKRRFVLDPAPLHDVLCTRRWQCLKEHDSDKVQLQRSFKALEKRKFDNF